MARRHPGQKPRWTRHAWPNICDLAVALTRLCRDHYQARPGYRLARRKRETNDDNRNTKTTGQATQTQPRMRHHQPASVPHGLITKQRTSSRASRLVLTRLVVQSRCHALCRVKPHRDQSPACRPASCFTELQAQEQARADKEKLCTRAIPHAHALTFSLQSRLTVNMFTPLATITTHNQRCTPTVSIDRNSADLEGVTPRARVLLTDSATARQDHGQSVIIPGDALQIWALLDVSRLSWTLIWSLKVAQRLPGWRCACRYFCRASPFDMHLQWPHPIDISPT